MCGACGTTDINGINSHGDDNAEAGITAQRLINVYLTSQAQIDDHELNHVPLRDWVPHT